jgi:FKBP-type peptidyl-prolyl cis-trans isomerase 2
MPDEETGSWLNLKTFIILCIVVGLVVAGAAIGYIFLSTEQKGGQYSDIEVELGDSVSVNYIGLFEDGTIFDTSLVEVANNDFLYPKSLSYTEKTQYTPLTFTVGEGQMIAGFDTGVFGMTVNETRELVIQPAQGYGEPDQSLIQVKSLNEKKPVYEWGMNATDFESLYFVPAQIGTTVKSNEYGWNMTVFYVDPVTKNIQFKHEPMLNEVTSLYDEWDSVVVSIDTNANNGQGEITLQHLLTQDDAGKILSYDSGGNEFRIISVNPGDGTYTVDYNREVVGRILIFKVTLVSITPK